MIYCFRGICFVGLDCDDEWQLRSIVQAVPALSGELCVILLQFGKTDPPKSHVIEVKWNAKCSFHARNASRQQLSNTTIEMDDCALCIALP